MRLFVSEYLCSGAWPEPVLPPSLAREGRAMLVALLTDLSALPDISLFTAWDVRLGAFPLVGAVAGGSPLSVECTVINDAGDESTVFDQLASECDATYVIAPELDNLLTQRVQSAIDAGGHSLNASPAAIAACSDKLESFRRLNSENLPTVPTDRFDPSASALPFEYPLVLKPRFGAGSQNTFLIHNANQLRTAAACFSSEQPTTEAIVQPYIPGRSLSVAAIIRSDGSLRELWPLGEQRLSTDGRFTYLGGRIPVALDPPLTSRASDLIFEISNLIPGLRGYVGIDLIVPQTNNAAPVIVDINPRLTTSYLGYRSLTTVKLAERLLWPDRDWPPVNWHNVQIGFRADGTLARSSSSRG